MGGAIIFGLGDKKHVEDVGRGGERGWRGVSQFERFFFFLPFHLRLWKEELWWRRRKAGQGQKNIEWRVDTIRRFHLVAQKSSRNIPWLFFSRIQRSRSKTGRKRLLVPLSRLFRANRGCFACGLREGSGRHRASIRLACVQQG